MEHYHVYPVNDLVEHNTGIVDDSYWCCCNPSYEYNYRDNQCVVVHESLDRREVFE